MVDFWDIVQFEVWELNVASSSEDQRKDTWEMQMKIELRETELGITYREIVLKIFLHSSYPIWRSKFVEKKI